LELTRQGEEEGEQGDAHHRLTAAHPLLNLLARLRVLRRRCGGERGGEREGELGAHFSCQDILDQAPSNMPSSDFDDLAVLESSD
jgi:hypothetical protein